MNEIVFYKSDDQKLITIIESLASEVWHECYTPIIGKKQVKYMLDNFQSAKAISAQIKDGFSYYLIMKDKSYIGYLGVVEKDSNLFLSKLYIKSEFRGNGYGKETLTFVENLAKEMSLAGLTLTVNKNNINAITAYKRFGFIIADSIIQDIGAGYVMDDYRMEKVFA